MPRGIALLVATALATASAAVPPSAEWTTSPWASCSAKCGGGVQLRDVVCKSTSTGTEIDASQCPAEKPARRRDCNVAACSKSCTAVTGAVRSLLAPVSITLPASIVGGLCADKRPAFAAALQRAVAEQIATVLEIPPCAAFHAGTPTVLVPGANGSPGTVSSTSGRLLRAAAAVAEDRSLVGTSACASGGGTGLTITVPVGLDLGAGGLASSPVVASMIGSLGGAGGAADMSAIMASVGSAMGGSLGSSIAAIGRLVGGSGSTSGSTTGSTIGSGSGSTGGGAGSTPPNFGNIATLIGTLTGGSTTTGSASGSATGSAAGSANQIAAQIAAMLGSLTTAMGGATSGSTTGGSAAAVAANTAALANLMSTLMAATGAAAGAGGYNGMGLDANAMATLTAAFGSLSAQLGQAQTQIGQLGGGGSGSGAGLATLIGSLTGAGTTPIAPTTGGATTANAGAVSEAQVLMALASRFFTPPASGATSGSSSSGSGSGSGSAPSTGFAAAMGASPAFASQILAALQAADPSLALPSVPSVQAALAASIASVMLDTSGATAMALGDVYFAAGAPTNAITYTTLGPAAGAAGNGGGGSGGLSAGAIAGIVVGCVGGVALLVVATVFSYRRMARSRRPSPVGSSEPKPVLHQLPHAMPVAVQSAAARGAASGDDPQ